ncbi:MAG: amidohydrolase family protein, partial [Pseudomonadota bacterium]|nr:amidohydrolase family protein [Pseudomonadota bacterium]
MATNDEWLAIIEEETLEPDLPICDPHHHLWEFRHDRVEPRYLMDEFQKDLGSGHKIVSTVFIECRAMYRNFGPEALRFIGETEFVNGVAAMSASGLYGPTKVASGIVGSAELMMGAATGETLDAHIAAGGGRFRGIRRSATWDPDPNVRNSRTDATPELLADPKFREGFAELDSRNLTFEAWVYHHQIPEVTDLARAFPGVTIILDHLGGPLGVETYRGKRDDCFEQWTADITELSRCENVMAKIGGINMDINGFFWHENPKPPTSQELNEATRKWYEHTIEQFGVNRCMFESNFPVDKQSCSYNV